MPNPQRRNPKQQHPIIRIIQKSVASWFTTTTHLSSKPTRTRINIKYKAYHAPPSSQAPVAQWQRSRFVIGRLAGSNPPWGSNLN